MNSHVRTSSDRGYGFICRSGSRHYYSNSAQSARNGNWNGFTGGNVRETGILSGFSGVISLRILPVSGALTFVGTGTCSVSSFSGDRIPSGTGTGIFSGDRIPSGTGTGTVNFFGSQFPSGTGTEISAGNRSGLLNLSGNGVTSLRILPVSGVPTFAGPGTCSF